MAGHRIGGALRMRDYRLAVAQNPAIKSDHASARARHPAWTTAPEAIGANDAGDADHPCPQSDRPLHVRDAGRRA